MSFARTPFHCFLDTFPVGWSPPSFHLIRHRRYPPHASYWSADEQLPVNGALHILKEKSIPGMRNENTLYYGPVFAVIALPAVVADLAVSFVFDGVRTAEQYKDKVVWDWGGILAWARLIAVCTVFLGLVAVFLLVQLYFTVRLVEQEG